MTLISNLPLFYISPAFLTPLLIQSFISCPLSFQLRSITVLFNAVKDNDSDLVSNLSSSFSQQQQQQQQQLLLRELGVAVAVPPGPLLVREWVRMQVIDINVQCFKMLASDEGLVNRPDIVEAYFKLLSKVM